VIYEYKPWLARISEGHQIMKDCLSEDWFKIGPAIVPALGVSPDRVIAIDMLPNHDSLLRDECKVGPGLAFAWTE
jgi:hypothetical protein